MSTNTMNNGPPPIGSTYRVKFLRSKFLQLIKIAQPEFIFHVKQMHFFSFQGFVVYSLECNSNDFDDYSIPVLEAEEFSNSTWSEGGGWI